MSFGIRLGKLRTNRKMSQEALAQIPETSRLYEAIMQILDLFKAGKSQKECFKHIHIMYDEYSIRTMAGVIQYRMP